MHSMRALDGALGAIAAAYVLVLLRHALEVFAAQRELAVAIRIHHVAHHLSHGQSLGALAIALPAGAAIVWANLLQPRREDLGVGVAERGGHGREILFELVDVGHAGHGGGDTGVLDDPAESGRPEVGGPFGLRRPTAASGSGHHFHSDHADAGLRQLLHRRRPGGILGEAILRLDYIQLGLNHAVDNGGQVCVAAHADEAHFALLLGLLLGRDHIVGDVRRVALAVEMPDVQVIGSEFLEAGIELRQDGRPVPPIALAGEENVLSLRAESRSHHALVLAALVAAGRIEVVDAHVRGTGNHSGIGGDHTAHADGGHFEAGLP